MSEIDQNWRLIADGWERAARIWMFCALLSISGAAVFFIALLNAK